MTGTKHAILLLALATAVGCAKTEETVSQGVTPLALNYYVLTQEAGRLRNDVRSAPHEELGKFLPKYGELIASGQQILKDAEAMKAAGKHQNLLALLDSSLQTQMGFLQLESRAVGDMAEYKTAGAEIERIEQQISGNTLARTRHQQQLDQLNSKVRQASGSIESLKPQLNVLSLRFQGQMKRYNQLLLESKLLTYTASEGILAPFDWERSPAAKAKTTAKSTTRKKKPRKP